MIEFEFDPEKSRSNQEKHGMNFEKAQELWHDPWRMVIPTRCTNEERWIMIAGLESGLWTVIYTIRTKKIRIISVRKTRENEKAVYYGGRA